MHGMLRLRQEYFRESRPETVRAHLGFRCRGTVFVRELRDTPSRYPRMGFASVHLGGTHVKALGSLSAALEVVEHARGYLYAFHRMPGTPTMRCRTRCVSFLRPGTQTWLLTSRGALVGGDVIDGKWTLQLV